MASPRRPFVGRDREIEELSSGLAEAKAGRGSLFLVVGAAGMGKTRLADELARAAQSAGLVTAWGRCWETGGAPAYWPWIQILQALARGSDGAALLASLGRDAGALAQLLPEVSPTPDGQGGAAAASRFQLFQAVVAFLRAAGERAPLLLVLDDLHAADPSSLALLHFVARALRGVRALVLGAYRDEEARLSADLGPVLTDIAREGTYLPLDALGRAEIATLVGAATGGTTTTELVEAIERASEGNPLFLNELLRLLLQRGDLARGQADPRTLPIPDTIKEVIGRRIARLPPEARAALATASVVGRDFGAGMVSALGGIPLAVLEPRLQEAERAGLIVSASAQSWRFSHVLVREALYRDLPHEQRAATHLQIARALERAAGPTDAGAEIAHHHLAALPAGDAGAALAAVRLAADRAMALLAFEDAAMLLERAQQALGAAGAGDPRTLCELELGAGLAHLRGGALERGHAACVRASEDARRLGDGELLARAALTYGAELTIAETDKRLVALLEEALGALPPGPGGLRAQCLARLAAALQPAPAPEQPMAMAREAVVMARAVGNDEVLRAVLSHAGSAMADYAHPAERAPLSEELARLAASADDRVLELRAEARLAFDYFDLGQGERSARAVDAYESIARELRQPRHLWPGRLMRAMLALGAGRFPDADRFLREACELAGGDRHPITALTFMFHRIGRALLTERASDLADAERELDELYDVLGRNDAIRDVWPVSLAALRARAGDEEGTRRHLGALNPASMYLVLDGNTIGMLAEAIALARDRALAEVLYHRLQPHADRLMSFGRTGMVCIGSVHASMGVFAGVLGDRDRAERHFQAALQRESAAGLAPTVAQVKLSYARLLLERRGPGDEDRARALAAEARSAADTFGLELLAGRLARLPLGPERPATAAPAARPTSPRPVGRAVTLVREGEYWAVSDGGPACRLKESRGLEMLAELVANPGREYHVLALMGARPEAIDGGDAGELLDQEAIGDYRARVEELDAEIAEAESWGDPGRAARAREEREAIAQELARGVGLGGRERRTGSVAERARTNVQRRIRGAIRKIAESLPELGTYLDRAVRTGTFCAYEPY